MYALLDYTQVSGKNTHNGWWILQVDTVEQRINVEMGRVKIRAKLLKYYQIIVKTFDSVLMLWLSFCCVVLNYAN
jgi:hypothetical protein